MSANNGFCLRPGCKGKAHSRGLCMYDYTVANDLVRVGKTTWEALETAKKIKSYTRREVVERWLTGAE